MTSARETPYHLTYTETHIASPRLRPDDAFDTFEASREQSSNLQSDAQDCDARGTHAFHNDEQAALSASPSSDVLPTTNANFAETTSRLRAGRSSLSITESTSSEGIRHNDPHDARAGADSHIHLLNQDTDSDIQVDPALSTKDQFCPGKDCPTRRDFRSTRLTWLNGTIVFICTVSTALSALFVVLAIKGQRYGNYIGNTTEARLSISTAILWTSVLAKTIEISFVTSFVAFLGQVLSRRAFVSNNGRGVTLSELTMWRWIVQPGSFITSLEIARYAGLSFLGVLTLLATVFSTLYVTAATALVQPISKQSDWHDKTMVGAVKTDFANYYYVYGTQQNCQMPRPNEENAAASCPQLEYSGKGSYNLANFLANWNDVAEVDHNTTIGQKHRPAWIASPYADTKVVPQWIDIVDTAEMSRKHKRVINNVSLALPHIGVVNAVRDQRNAMPQSATPDVTESFSLWASVPSPVLNVLCVDVNLMELRPIVYEAWPDSGTTELNVSTVLPRIRNDTVIDELFGWTKKDVNYTDYPPLFARYPTPFGINLDDPYGTWDDTAMYMLGRGGYMDGVDSVDRFPLCKFELDTSSHCSTLYSVTLAGSKVEALCEERAGDMAYFKTDPEATTIQGVGDWRDIGIQWAKNFLLVAEPQADIVSQSKVLMMLLLQPEDADPTNFTVELNNLLPSLAETLAIAASDTLFSSFQDAPFAVTRNYTPRSIDGLQTQWFTAKIKSQEYASGGVDNASKGWLVVLISTFLLNLVVLVYFILQPGLVTDFSQPPQLFALAMNSPPTKKLAGSCGCGPEGKEYKICWSVGSEGGHVYIEPKSPIVADLSGSDRISPHQALDRGTSKDNRFYYTLIAAFSRMKPESKSDTHKPIRRSASFSAEPLRSLHATQSVLSLGSQYEHGDIEMQTQQQSVRLPGSRTVP